MKVAFCGPAGTEPAEWRGVRLVCASDTHSLRRWQQKIPLGDVFVHAGDFTRTGTRGEIGDFVDFVVSLPHEHKIVVAGNHELTLDVDSYVRTGAGRHKHHRYDPAECRALLRDVTYLQDAETTAAGVRFWGSPWTPEFGGWAFGAERGEALTTKFASIPVGVDVLVTHGPPLGVRDEIMRGYSLGCKDLRAAVARVRPAVHVFGHIHDAYGHETRDGTLFVNAAICDENNRDVHAPTVVDLVDDE